METPKEYYYTYYSYEEWGRGYFGSRGCKCLPEEDVKYFGSFSDKNFNPTQKIILKDDYATREEAYADEIILQQYYKVVENPHFANRAYQTSTKFYVPREQAIENSKKNGNKTYNLGKGIHARTPEQMSKDGKKGAQKAKELGLGIYSFTQEQRSENGKKYNKNAGKKTYELGVGIHGRTKEKMTEDGIKGGTKIKELGIGIHGRTKEQMSEDGRKGAQKTANQRWKCLETGHISNAPGLSHYQRARGIDTSQRIRVSNSWGL